MTNNVKAESLSIGEFQKSNRDSAEGFAKKRKLKPQAISLLNNTWKASDEATKEEAKKKSLQEEELSKG